MEPHATQVPFLTIFIPTAEKRQPFLRNCLARLTFQEARNFEAIVISDGELPDCAELKTTYDCYYPLELLEDKEPKHLWGHPQTAEAIKRMKGKWFIRINDDNIVYPQFTRVIQMHGNKASSSILIWRVYFANQMPPDGRPLILPTILPPRYGAIDMLNFAIRSDLAKAVGFPFRSHGSDWEFLSACLQQSHGKYDFIPEILGEHW